MRFLLVIGITAAAAITAALLCTRKTPQTAVVSGLTARPLSVEGDWSYIESVTSIPDGMILALTSKGCRQGMSHRESYRIAHKVHLLYGQIPERSLYGVDLLLDEIAREIRKYAALSCAEGDSLDLAAPPIELHFADFQLPLWYYWISPR